MSLQFERIFDKFSTWSRMYEKCSCSLLCVCVLLLLLCIAARVSTERRQHSTAARKELKLTGSADRGTTWNWLNGKLSSSSQSSRWLRCLRWRSFVRSFAAATFAPTRTHTERQADSYRAKESEPVRLQHVCEHIARGTVDGSLSAAAAAAATTAAVRSLALACARLIYFRSLCLVFIWLLRGDDARALK